MVTAGRGSETEGSALLEGLRAANERLALAAVQAREQALQARFERAETDAVLEAIADGVLVYDAEGTVVRANSAMAAIFGLDPVGLTREDLIGCVDIRHPDDRPLVPAELPASRVLRGEKVVRERYLITNLNGGQALCLVSASPLERDGRVAGAVAVWREIAERERAHELVQESEQMYGALFSQMTEGFALHEMVDAEDGSPGDYRFLDVNPAFEALTGLTREAVVGRTVREVLPGIEGYWIDTYARVALTGKPTRFENYSEPLGRQFEVFAFSPKRGQFATIFVDVTERKRLMCELRRRAGQLGAVVESTHALLALLDRDFNFVLANAAYVESSRHIEAELVGRNHFDLFPNEENEAIFRRVRDTGKPYHAVEKPFEYADQPERGVTYWNWTLVPVEDGDGAVAGLVLSLLDVTPQVRARQRVQELAEEAKQVAAERERLLRELERLARASLERADLMEDVLRMVSHDLRNPLTVITGTAQWLQGRLGRAGLEAEASAVERVNVSGRRMDSMIRDLVDSARLEAGRLELHPEPTDLLQVIDDLSARIGTAADRARIVVEVREPLPPAQVDPERLERVLVNLVSNALRYSTAGTPVLITAETASEGVVVSVTDQGEGVPAGDLPHIFERFYRASNRKRDSLGLGLYITRLIVEAHGGRIWCDSEVGKGTTFSFTLLLA